MNSASELDDGVSTHNRSPQTHLLDESRHREPLYTGENKKDRAVAEPHRHHERGPVLRGEELVHSPQDDQRLDRRGDRLHLDGSRCHVLRLSLLADMGLGGIMCGQTPDAASEATRGRWHEGQKARDLKLAQAWPTRMDIAQPRGAPFRSDSMLSVGVRLGPYHITDVAGMPTDHALMIARVTPTGSTASSGRAAMGRRLQLPEEECRATPSEQCGPGHHHLKLWGGAPGGQQAENGGALHLARASTPARSVRASTRRVSSGGGGRRVCTGHVSTGSRFSQAGGARIQSRCRAAGWTAADTSPERSNECQKETRADQCS